MIEIAMTVAAIVIAVFAVPPIIWAMTKIPFINLVDRWYSWWLS